MIGNLRRVPIVSNCSPKKEDKVLEEDKLTKFVHELYVVHGQI